MTDSQTAQIDERRGVDSQGDMRVLAALAASCPGAAVVYLGADSVEAAGSLLSGIDITTRLLLVSDTQTVANRLHDSLPADLRLSVHVQDFGGFLNDVKAHQFAFLVCGTTAASHVEDAARLIAPGGFLVGATGLPAIGAGSEWIVAPLGGASWAWLATRRARPVPRRRGGRGRPSSA
ncbi:MAG: hypothetical protein AAF458_18270 [Pseudomonadota bacterium]